MFYLDSYNQRYYVGTPFTYNSIKYTKANATVEKFTELGFTAVQTEDRPDDRFYEVGLLLNDGTYEKQERDLGFLKSFFVSELKQQAHDLLSKTDWYIIRAIEAGISGTASTVPASASTYRSTVRSLVATREAQINATASVAALKTLIDTPIAFPDAEGSY